MNYIKSAFSILGECIKQEDAVGFEKQIMLIAKYLGYETKANHCERLYRTICDKRYHSAFKIDDLKRIAITFHSSKGLEFEQVIMFVSDYRLSSEQDIYNHYVAATRAKSKLIMVYINDDWRYRIINGVKEAWVYDRNTKKYIQICSNGDNLIELDTDYTSLVISGEFLDENEEEMQ